MRNKDVSYIQEHGGSADADLIDRYSYRVTDNVKQTICGDVSVDPVARQYIPQNVELMRAPDEDDDPIGDDAHSPVKGIVHRYPGRVLFKPANVCAVYCRYCFRREMVGPKGDKVPDILKDDERAAALDYIAQNPEIREVILTGGDPLILSMRQLSETMGALSAIEHVQVIRIHSRVPIADPDRITKELCDMFEVEKAVYMAVHINHANEITDAVRDALKHLHRAGVNLLSQSVLLCGVNDSADTLADLYRALIAINVKPYYLHHPDLAPGTSHFRVSIQDGQDIMRRLLGRLSGLAQPTYMLDIPGGYGKIPLTPCYIEEQDAGRYRLRDYQGGDHEYG